jgi:acetyl esterase/lipase
MYCCCVILNKRFLGFYSRGQVFGHSLGGAVAAALAVQLHSEFQRDRPRPQPAASSSSSLSDALGLVGESQAARPPKVSALTFGTPPCFWYTFPPSDTN